MRWWTSVPLLCFLFFRVFRWARNGKANWGQLDVALGPDEPTHSCHGANHLDASTVFTGLHTQFLLHCVVANRLSITQHVEDLLSLAPSLAILKAGGNLILVRFGGDCFGRPSQIMKVSSSLACERHGCLLLGPDNAAPAAKLATVPQETTFLGQLSVENLHSLAAGLVHASGFKLTQ